MGRIEADIALQNWLFGFCLCSGWGKFTLYGRLVAHYINMSMWQCFGAVCFSSDWHIVCGTCYIFFLLVPRCSAVVVSMSTAAAVDTLEALVSDQ